MYSKTIKFDREQPFEEEILPQQTLLHVYFTDLKGNRYRWTPAIRGGDVEKIFFKMFEVEEKNNPDGVWREELKIAAEKVPLIKDFKLPVQIKFGGLEDVKNKNWKYKVKISILREDVDVYKYQDNSSFKISDCVFKMSSLSDILIEREILKKWNISISEYCEEYFFENSYYAEGIAFYIWLKEYSNRFDYQMIIREVVWVIRSYIRSVLLDSKAIQRGIEEIPK